jgi:4a-hydroxytetrahydrobiopterin dehydratase
MNTTVNDLATKQCKPCEGAMPPLSQEEITQLMRQLDGWNYLGK